MCAHENTFTVFFHINLPPSLLRLPLLQPSLVYPLRFRATQRPRLTSSCCFLLPNLCVRMAGFVFRLVFPSTPPHAPLHKIQSRRPRQQKHRGRFKTLTAVGHHHEYAISGSSTVAQQLPVSLWPEVATVESQIFSKFCAAGWDFVQEFCRIFFDCQTVNHLACRFSLDLGASFFLNFTFIIGFL